MTNEMHFLPDIYVPCDAYGKRYNRETLEIKFKDMNISEVLNSPWRMLLFFEPCRPFTANYKR